MALSLRTRLTAWYSVLLVLTVAVFSAAVLWLHWRLLVEQFDEGLTSISATATNVVEEELGELHDLGPAAAEMAAVVHPSGYVVQVLDASGLPIQKVSQPLPLPADVRAPGFTGVTRTLVAADGREWRVTVRGKTVYEVETLVNGKSRDLMVDAAGKVYDVEEQIDLAQAPAPVRAAIEAKGTLLVLERATSRGTVHYEGQVRTKAGKKAAFDLDPDGKAIAKK